jgi:hypothetical protein
MHHDTVDAAQERERERERDMPEPTNANEDERPEEATTVRGPMPAIPLAPVPGKRVVVWLQDEETPSREFEDIMLRRVPSGVAHHFRGAAGARGLTHAQYLSALVALHDVLRLRVDGGDTDAAATLDQLGLRTVSI